MHCKFLIAFVLMGACLIQTSSAQPSFIVGGVQRSIIDIAIKNANELILKGIDVIQSKINEALQNINELKFKVTQEVAKAIQAVREKLEEVIRKAKEAIEEIKKKAEEAGIDISNCIKDNESKFQDLLEKFLADEVQCVTKEVDSVMKIINETVEMMTNTIDTLTKFPNDLLNCASNSRPLTCVTDITVNIIKMQKDVPVQIANKVQEITAFVTGLQTRLQICATTQVTSAAVAAAGVVGDIAKCAADKGLKHINL